MISSKAASTVSCPGFSSGFCGVLSSAGLSAFLGTAPSLWALLGAVAEAVPSGATSAARYQQSERIGFAAVLDDLNDRHGIKQELQSCDVDVLSEMFATLADKVRGLLPKAA